MTKGTCRSIETEQWRRRLATVWGGWLLAAASHGPSLDYSIGRSRFGAPFTTCPPLHRTGRMADPASHPGE
jgi:hypothetical protein